MMHIYILFDIYIEISITLIYTKFFILNKALTLATPESWMPFATKCDHRYLPEIDVAQK